MARRLEDVISRLTLEEKLPLLIARNSPKGSVPRLGIPEYDWGANCIHGVQSRCSNIDGRCPTSFPNPNALGSTFNDSLWHSMGGVMGLELRSLWLQGVGENHPVRPNQTRALPHIGLDCWSPNIGIVRDPRWGRNLETPSEDPLLNGRFGVAVTRGLQVGRDEVHSDRRYLQAVVTLKHFAANSLEGDWGPQGGITRHSVDSHVSQYDLASTYLPAFKRSVMQGNAKGVMCSYNAVNGVPSCASEWLLQRKLRDEWNFTGYVTSDSGAVQDIFHGNISGRDQGHHYTTSWPETVAAALNAGCDVESATWGTQGAFATGGPYVNYTPAAIRMNLTSEARVDRALRHSLGLRFELGLFDPIADQPYWHVPPSVVQASEHVALSLDATRQGLVLLQNGGGDRRNPAQQKGHTSAKGSRRAGGEEQVTATAALNAGEGPWGNRVLPFYGGQRTAVLGPHANNRSTLLGNYLGQICSSGFHNHSCVPTVFEAIAALNAKSAAARNVTAHTTTASGVDVNSTDALRMAQALKLGAEADVIVFAGGLDTATVEREGHDRHDIRLPGLQPTLLASLLALGKPLALVLVHGGTLTLPPAILAHPNLAIISAGYPGVHGARAVADALFDVPGIPGQHQAGQHYLTTLAVNRFGKTTATWYSEPGWADAQFDMLSFDMAHPPGRTYRYYTGEPQWPFGYGLSNAQLRLAPAAGGGAHESWSHHARQQQQQQTPTPAQGVPCDGEVWNDDEQRSSDAIVLFYLKPKRGAAIPPAAPAAALQSQMIHSVRMHQLYPKTSRRIAFTLTLEHVTLADAQGQPVVYEGLYDVLVSLGVGDGGGHGGGSTASEVTIPFECTKQTGCKCMKRLSEWCEQ